MTPSSDADRLLGDYRLKELVLETPLAYRWVAEQESVGRVVLVDELKPEMMGEREQFLADVRAKAAMKHPLIASVYEAVSEEDCCYYAHEAMPGGTLEERVAAGEPMKPSELAHFLGSVAEVQKQYENQKQATIPLTLQHIHLDAHGVLRLDNLVKDGERGDKGSVRDMGYLGRALRPLVADGQPGTTRLMTLLSWMRGETVKEPLTWDQVIELCEHIEKQLSDPQAAQSSVVEDVRSDRKRPTVLISIIGFLGIAVVLLAALRMRPGAKEPVVQRVDLPEPVLVPSSMRTGPDGSQYELPSFRMAAHEVTIGQYAQFLDRLETHEKNGSEHIFDHESQPEDKVSHVPEDWAAISKAAMSGGRWGGQPVSLDSPVVGVDWWDAMAYAEWKHARLPKHAEWMAALGVTPDRVAQIQAAGWGSVDLETADRSGHGVLNMAGSVSEWMLNAVANPANPMGEKRWLVIGGSYLQEGSHALSREWIDDRSLRRADLGFRLVFDED